MRAFILADGPPLPRALRDRVRRGRFTILLDGAAEIARRERWLPDLITGDFDSLSARSRAYFAKRGVDLLETPDQNFTDLHKAIAWCRLKDMRSIWIAQALDQRLDHSLGNLALLKHFHERGRELLIFSATERVRFLRDEKIRLRGKSGRRVAIIPFPECKVSSQGLAYEMKGVALALGMRESISNRARRAEVAISLKGEALVIEEYRRE